MERIKLMRLYDVIPPCGEQTYLVDRLWPRGVSKEKLAGAIWLKEVAPSNELRKWYHQHLDQFHWIEFAQRYRQELVGNTSWNILFDLINGGQSITLLYGSKDVEHNHAVILRDFLFERLSSK